MRRMRGKPKIRSGSSRRFGGQRVGSIGGNQLMTGYLGIDNAQTQESMHIEGDWDGVIYVR